MSMDAGNYKITVVELLNREGHDLPGGQRIGGRAAATAAGVAVLCGATVTGMIALAPSLSHSILPSSPDSRMASGSYDESSRPSARDGDRQADEATGGAQTEGATERGVPQAAPLGGGPSRAAGAEASGAQVPAMSQLGDPFHSPSPTSSEPGDPPSGSAGTSDASDPSESERSGAQSSEPAESTTATEQSETSEPSQEAPESSEASEPSEEAAPEPSGSSEPSEEEAPEPSESEKKKGKPRGSGQG